LLTKPSKNENITLSNNLIAINEETRINPNSIHSSVPIIRAIIPDKIHARLKSWTTTIAVQARRLALCSI